MKLLLDTQLLLWAAGQPERLSKVASKLLNDPRPTLSRPYRCAPAERKEEVRLLVSGTTWGRTGASRGGRGRGHRGGSRGQGMARAERQPATGRGLEPPGLAGCLFWWFGGREEEGAAVVVDINPSGGVS